MRSNEYNDKIVRYIERHYGFRKTACGMGSIILISLGVTLIQKSGNGFVLTLIGMACLGISYELLKKWNELLRMILTVRSGNYRIIDGHVGEIIPIKNSSKKCMVRFACNDGNSR